jgi:phosphohistidine phosphatase
MRLYLFRHGEATSDAENPKRPLSAAGRARVEQMARHLARVAAAPEDLVVRHSGKLRAAQTAEVLAAHLPLRQSPQQADGLAPGDPPERTLDLIDAAESDLMLVGHLPHLARLASLLLSGESDRISLVLPAAAVVCLEAESGRWRLHWLITPALGG